MPEGPSLFLLDPYRAALLARGLEEGLAQPHRGTAKDFLGLPALDVGRNKDLQDTILQQLLLFDRVLIVQNENLNEEWDRFPAGIINVSWRNLRDDGLVEFVSDETLNAPAITSLPGEYPWLSDQEAIRKWRPLLVEQFRIKKKISHPSLFDILLNRHRPDFNAKKAVKCVPERFRRDAKKLADGQDGKLLDLSIISLVHELLQVEAFVSKREAEQATTYLSLPSPIAPPFWRNAGDAGELVEIVIHELLQENIEFTLPTSLREARDLRKTPDIAAFRSVFLPWLDTVRAGQVVDEGRLRKEVSRAAKCFKLMSTSKRSISVWSVIGSIATDLLTGSPLAGGAFHLGADWFAGRLERRGRWIGLCGRERSSPLTVADVAAADQRLASRRRRNSPPSP